MSGTVVAARRHAQNPAHRLRRVLLAMGLDKGYLVRTVPLRDFMGIGNSSVITVAGSRAHKGL